MVTRLASHAGSWYSANPLRLAKQLEEFVKQAPAPVSGARLLIGPHAGYSYAGATLAETYNVWDTSKVERVFILGPSHHIYFQGVAYLSGADEYETPFGNILVDTKVVDDLCKSKVFKKMDMETDEDEHSFEMHAPYIYKMTEGLPQGIPKIIPIMISHGDRAFDDAVSSILAKYLNDETNTFVISSDFCHWGSRFGYTKYTPAESLEYLKSLKHMSRIPIDGLKIYQSIRFLDRYATKVISTGSSSQWKDYIQISGNTICGQHPISLLLQTIEKVRELEGKAQDWALFNWIGYTQSSKVITPDDSSVSYASGYAVTD